MCSLNRHEPGSTADGSTAAWTEPMMEETLKNRMSDRTDSRNMLASGNPHTARGFSFLLTRNELRDTFRISYLANRLVLPVYEEIKQVHGLSRGEYLLLFCLSHTRELTAQDVAEITGRPRNSISRAVHRMLEEGYLTRSPDPSDGRQALLRITGKGREVNDKILPRFRQQEERILNNLNPDERTVLATLLTKLVHGPADL